MDVYPAGFLATRQRILKLDAHVRGLVDYANMTTEERRRETYILEYLNFERNARYLDTEVRTIAALVPHMEKGGFEDLVRTKEKFWDQCFPWDFYQRVYESQLSKQEQQALKKKRVLTGFAALQELHARMTQAGEL